MTYYLIITQHQDHPAGRWTLGAACYATRDEAIIAAHAAWDGTGVRWRLVTIPGEEEG